MYVPPLGTEYYFHMYYEHGEDHQDDLDLSCTLPWLQSYPQRPILKVYHGLQVIRS